VVDAKGWHAARLIPASGIGDAEEQERRATTALLAVIGAVPAFGRALTELIGAPSGPVETYVEVPLRMAEGTFVAGGAIQVHHAPDVWTALVEVRTGGRGGDPVTLGDYLDVATAQGLDAVVVVGGDPPGEPPAGGVALRHLPWGRVVAEAVRQRDTTSDPARAWILRELVRYLDHPASGVSAVADELPVIEKARPAPESPTPITDLTRGPRVVNLTKVTEPGSAPRPAAAREPVPERVAEPRHEPEPRPAAEPDHGPYPPAPAYARDPAPVSALAAAQARLENGSSAPPTAEIALPRLPTAFEAFTEPEPADEPYPPATAGPPHEPTPPQEATPRMEPTPPMEPAAPMEPTPRTEAVAPHQPVAPHETAAPHEPVRPHEPAAPQEPARPYEPAAPHAVPAAVDPAGPVEPSPAAAAMPDTSAIVLSDGAPVPDRPPTRRELRLARQLDALVDDEPGWYLDPGGADALRWWSGTAWSTTTYEVQRVETPAPTRGRTHDAALTTPR
jgi:hypothetical protein